MIKGACRIITMLYGDTVITFSPDFFHGIYASPANLPLDASMKLPLQSEKTVYISNGQSFSLNSENNLNMPTVTMNFGIHSG